MKACSAVREVQQWGAGALRHLAMDIGENQRDLSETGEVQLTMRGVNKRMIAKAGGIDLIVRAMKKFPEELELQENGCAALCNLASNRLENKVLAARAGAIQVTVQAMKAFPDEEELLQHC